MVKGGGMQAQPGGVQKGLDGVAVAVAVAAGVVGVQPGVLAARMSCEVVVFVVLWIESTHARARKRSGGA